MSNARTASRISGNCGIRSSGGGGRCALYSLYISVRNVFSDLSKMTARWVGLGSLISAEQLPQHGAEAIDRVDVDAVRRVRGEADRVIGAENVAGAVDQEDVVVLLQPGGNGGIDSRRFLGCGFGRSRFGGRLRGFWRWHGGNVGRRCGFINAVRGSLWTRAASSWPAGLRAGILAWSPARTCAAARTGTAPASSAPTRTGPAARARPRR